MAGESIVDNDQLDVIRGVRGVWSTRRRIDHLFAVAVVRGHDDRTALFTHRAYNLAHALVHRLDRDTSGVLILARTVSAAAWLGSLFRGREMTKLYWALVVGEPERDEGRIDLALAKRSGPHGERVVGDPDGRAAVTDFKVIDRVGRQAAWLALRPLTGRTHQLRAHCAAIGTPIMGDGKYGGADAFLAGGFSKALHLHAQSLTLPKRSGGVLKLTAPLPAHMAETWRLFGFDPAYDDDPFAEVER